MLIVHLQKQVLTFLIDKISVKCDGHVLKQTVGNPMCITCNPLLAGYSSSNRKDVARCFEFSFLFIDDGLSLNILDSDEYL